MKKIFVLLMAVVLMMSAAACGQSEKKEAVKGEVKTSGLTSVLVPEGYVLTDGSIVASSSITADEKQCYLQPEETKSNFDYIWITIKKDEADCASSCSMTKNVNEAEDITVTTKNNGEWKGCKYYYDSLSNGKIACGQVYAVVGETAFLVSFASYEPEGEILQAVLNSLKAAA